MTDIIELIMTFSLVTIGITIIAFLMAILICIILLLRNFLTNKTHKNEIL